ncbi:MAG: DUF2270 domain-containing protein, partial [Myxococcales bacterium]|nr:DUF2270 domain-containing protein [Myxococcales bacterium]
MPKPDAPLDLPTRADAGEPDPGVIIDPSQDGGRAQDPAPASRLPDAAVTPLVHFYRAEIGRGDVWRQRMDATTNWAIGTTAALVSVAFSRPDIPHVIIPLGGLIVLLLLCIEGRRYRFYDVWRQRTRLIEAHFIVPQLRDQRPTIPAWREHLAADLLRPAYKLSFMRATGSRLRRNYIWIFLLLLLCWIARIAAIVSEAGDVKVVFAGAHISARDLYGGIGYGPVPGWAMLGLTGAFYGGLGLWIWWSGRSPDPDAMVYARAG